LSGTVSTVGHSTRSADELIELLLAHGIAVLVDVRTVPRSRHNPQFDQSALPATLEAAGLAYRHMADLGGLRKPRPDSPHTAWTNPSFRGYADHMDTPAFALALDQLIALARERSTAVMCAEAVPWRCHRSLIADALLARGIEVRHIHDARLAEPHRLTPFARIVGARVAYPGLGSGAVPA
jgi:uncharacterized protein (DUF488 family)